MIREIILISFLSKDTSSILEIDKYKEIIEVYINKKSNI